MYHMEQTIWPSVQTGVHSAADTHQRRTNTPHLALFFTQRPCNVTQVQGVGRYGSFPAAFWGLAGVNLHRFRDGVHRVSTVISKSLLRLLLPNALLKGLALVSKFDNSLCVGVEGGDRSPHAKGEGCPGHADVKQEKNWECGEAVHIALFDTVFGEIRGNHFRPVHRSNSLGHMWDQTIKSSPHVLFTQAG